MSVYFSVLAVKLCTVLPESAIGTQKQETKSKECQAAHSYFLPPRVRTNLILEDHTWFKNIHRAGQI
jgi:hypothetical protein